MLAAWDRAAEKGLLRYPAPFFEERVLPGALAMRAHFTSGRASKRTMGRMLSWEYPGKSLRRAGSTANFRTGIYR